MTQTFRSKPFKTRKEAIIEKQRVIALLRKKGFIVNENR